MRAKIIYPHGALSSSVDLTRATEEFYPIVPIAAIFCREKLLWLSRDELHFQFDGFGVTAGQSIHEIVAKPHYRVDTIGIGFCRRKTPVDELLFRND